MKKLFALIFAIIIVAFSTVCVSATPDYKALLDKTLAGVKTEFEPMFSLPDGDLNKLTADMWYVYPLCAAGKTQDENYGFLVPSYDNPTTSNGLTKSILTDILLGKTPNAQQVSELKSKQGNNGAFQNDAGYDSVSETAYAVIALKLADNGCTAEKAFAYIKSEQKADGGYNDYGDEGNVDTTGMVLTAFAVGGENGGLTEKARDFILSTQQSDGALVGKGAYDSANSCSQSMGVVGLISAGVDMSKYPKITENLLSYMDKNGCFWYDADCMSGKGFYTAPDMFSTYQGMMALADLGYGNVFKSLLPKPEPEKTTITEAATTAKAHIESASDVQSDLISPDTGAPEFPTAVVIVAVAAGVVLIFAIVVTIISKKKK